MKYRFNTWLMAMSFALFLSVLAGCISAQRSPSSRFYDLQPMKEAGSASLADTAGLADAIVGIGPLTLPEYYDRPQIVTRKADETIEFAQFDRWAQPLDQAMTGVIFQDLSLLLPKTTIDTFPWNTAIPVKYQVIMKVVQLDCRMYAEALLRMQWSILDSRDKKVLFSEFSEYKVPVKPHNFPGLGQALSAICESISRDIAQALIDLGRKELEAKGAL